MTIIVDVNSRTYFIVVPRLTSRFSTLADFEASVENRHIVFSKAQKIIKCNTYLWLLKHDDYFYMHVSYLARSVVLVKTSGDRNLFSDVFYKASECKYSYL